MKIDIFSGFLGAGKTTLIKKLIKEAYVGEKVVLIENEFGEIGVDGGFLRDAGVEITEMNSGCICCSLVGDFAKALKKVTEDYDPDRIIIEPSGVGKLSDVEKAVEKGLDGAPINTKTTVVNVKKCLMYAKNFGEFFLDQLENADCVVLSHTDDASEAKTAECLAFVKERNPDASVIASPLNELDGKEILSAMENRSSAKKMADELLSEHEKHECCHHHHDEDEDEHEHCRHHHDEDEDEDEHCRHHHHDDDEDEHEHCCHHHDEDEDEDEHEHCCHHHHDEDEHEHCCHHHDEDGHEHHHHHHGHDADEVFVSWGKETTATYTKERLEGILAALSDEEKFGTVLRAKGIVRGSGEWLHFDYIPDGTDVRSGSADVVGKICVIGSKLNENALCELFGL
ncbi:MAG: CobW family GTP-binding protein [Christensenellales bacterium]